MCVCHRLSATLFFFLSQPNGILLLSKNQCPHKYQPQSPKRHLSLCESHFLCCELYWPLNHNTLCSVTCVHSIAHFDCMLIVCLCCSTKDGQFGVRSTGNGVEIIDLDAASPAVLHPLSVRPPFFFFFFVCFVLYRGLVMKVFFDLLCDCANWLLTDSLFVWVFRGLIVQSFLSNADPSLRVDTTASLPNAFALASPSGLLNKHTNTNHTNTKNPRHTSTDNWKAKNKERANTNKLHTYTHTLSQARLWL